MNKFTLDGNWKQSDFAAINPFGQTRDQQPHRKKVKTVVVKDAPGCKRKQARDTSFEPTPDHRKKMVENGKKVSVSYRRWNEKEYSELIEVARQGLKDIGDYASYLHGTNRKCLARLASWERFIKICVALRGKAPQENTLRRAIRVVMDEAGERWMMPDQHTTRAWIREVQ